MKLGFTQTPLKTRTKLLEKFSMVFQTKVLMQSDCRCGLTAIKFPDQIQTQHKQEITPETSVIRFQNRLYRYWTQHITLAILMWTVRTSMISTISFKFTIHLLSVVVLTRRTWMIKIMRSGYWIICLVLNMALIIYLPSIRILQLCQLVCKQAQ